MTTLTKEIKGLIEKFSINPETNVAFADIMDAFDGAPNYQAWGIRLVFSDVITCDELKTIANWVHQNPQLISSLSKKNVVAYTKKNIHTLFSEMTFLSKDKLIRDVISHFNTTQRRLLTEWYKDHMNDFDGIFKIFSSFNKLTADRKQKFYTTCSAVYDSTMLIRLLKDCLTETYNWLLGKDDLLRYIEANTSDCDVVYNEGNIVIVEVPSFKSSHKLCGSGRTQWCISREASYFRSYVTDYNNSRRQYFLFDFSRKETDAFAHIGFTLENGKGIVEAQTCNNYSMMSSYQQGTEKYSISSFLASHNIPMTIFMRLPKELGYKWNDKFFTSLVKQNPSIKITWNKDAIYVMEFTDINVYRKLFQKTYFHINNHNCNDSLKVFVILNFAKQINNDDAAITFVTEKDIYNQQKIVTAENIYGQTMTNDQLCEIIPIEEICIKEKLEPQVLLHKYIDDKNEKGALQLLEKYKDIDVNFEFDSKLPIYKTINQRMGELFNAIVNYPTFNPEISDGLGETLIESILYLTVSATALQLTEDDKRFLNGMLASIMNVPNYNFNVRDLNQATALHATCEYAELTAVTENLVKRKYVDVNVVNDMNETPLSVAIKNNNIEAIKLLGLRTDLVIRQEDAKLAEKNGIKLSAMIKPTDRIFAEVPCHKY